MKLYPDLVTQDHLKGTVWEREGWTVDEVSMVLREVKLGIMEAVRMMDFQLLQIYSKETII